MPARSLPDCRIMKTTSPIPLTLALTAILSLAGTSPVPAALLTTQHVDIGVADEEGLFLHWHDEDNAAEYAPGEAAAYIHPTAAQLTMPSNSAYSFIGAAPGESIWVLPQTQDPNLLFLGVGAEEADGIFETWNPGDSRGANTSGAWIELSLVSVSGPGHFSVWQNDGFGSPIVYMSTFEGGVGSADKLFIGEGGHAHYNWGFTELGAYEVVFQARAFIGGEEVTSQGTFVFTSVPEPGSIFLGAATGFGALLMRRRRRRS